MRFGEIVGSFWDFKESLAKELEELRQEAEAEEAKAQEFHENGLANF